MKKQIIALIAAVSVLGSPASAMAEGIDLTGMNVEQLLTLRQQIDEAILNQGGATVIDYGEYLAGRDIAPGSYTISVYSESDLAGVYVSILRSSESKAQYEAAWNEYYNLKNEAEKIEESGGTPSYPVAPNNSDYYIVLDDLVEVPGGTYRVSLEEGQILVLSDWCDNVTMTISKEEGLFME